MSKNTNLSQLDHNQLVQREHDQSNDAKRVVIVGGEKLDISIDSDKIAQAVKDGMANIKFPKDDRIGDAFNLIEVEKQVFIPQIEYRTIEVPVIVKEIQYREIEKPVYITEYKTIEVPSGVKENISKEVPILIKVLLGSHALTWLGLLINHFIK